MNKNIIFDNRVRHVIVGLIIWIIPEKSKQLTVVNWFESFASYINQLAKDKGRVQVVSVIKQIQLHTTRYLAGAPLYSNNIRIGLNANGLPKSLRGENGKIHDHIRNRDPQVLRAIMTVLSVIRTFKGDGSLEAKTIISPSTSDQSVEEDIERWLVTSQYSTRLKESFNTLLNKNLWRLPHLSTKMGPNGQATGTSLRDLQLLPEWLRKDIEVIGGKYLKDYLWTLRDSISTIPHWVHEKVSTRPFLRRLSVVRDKALKNRPIAILDYWSQTTLLPLHKSLMGVLESLDPDMTFDQMGIERRLGAWTSYHSLDLSAATDRFPISLQRRILRYLRDDQYSSAWSNIMVGLPFLHNGNEYRYNAGQPMGAYSSWAMFALSHHVVIQYCAFKAGINSEFKDYAVLGDDVVIGRKDVAGIYKEVIKNLGVDISDNKSHESENFCEFAKNMWLIDDTGVVNISGVPLPGVLESFKNPFSMAQELRKSQRKGTLDNTSVPVSTSIRSFISQFASLQKRGWKWAQIIIDWWNVMDAIEWVKHFKTDGSCDIDLPVDTRYSEGDITITGGKCLNRSDLYTSSNPWTCTRPSVKTYLFFRDLLIADVKEAIWNSRKELIRCMQRADRRNNSLYDEVMMYHDNGPDRDSLPNLGGVMYQPWYWAMENQVKLVDDAYERVCSDRFSRDLAIEWEEMITIMGSLRISDPDIIDSRRAVDVVNAFKRKRSSVLLPYVRSL